jgi:hypothetical protein
MLRYTYVPLWLHIQPDHRLYVVKDVLMCVCVCVCVSILPYCVEIVYEFLRIYSVVVERSMKIAYRETI